MGRNHKEAYLKALSTKRNYLKKGRLRGEAVSPPPREVCKGSLDSLSRGCCAKELDRCWPSWSLWFLLIQGLASAPGTGCYLPARPQFGVTHTARRSGLPLRPDKVLSSRQPRRRRLLWAMGRPAEGKGHRGPPSMLQRQGPLLEVLPATLSCVQTPWFAGTVLQQNDKTVQLLHLLLLFFYFHQ